MKTVEPRWEMVQRQREQALQLQAQITVAEEKEISHQRDAERIRAELDAIAKAKDELKDLREKVEPLLALTLSRSTHSTFCTAKTAAAAR